MLQQLSVIESSTSEQRDAQYDALAQMLEAYEQADNDCQQGDVKADGGAVWDFIVVGSAAGGVLASKLVQRGSSVLLIEAGCDHRSADMTPEMAAANPMALWAVTCLLAAAAWVNHFLVRIRGGHSRTYWCSAPVHRTIGHIQWVWEWAAGRA